jgi:hypothetical protein
MKSLKLIISVWVSAQETIAKVMVINVLATLMMSVCLMLLRDALFV